MKTAATLHREAFDKPRDPRSHEYKHGVLEGIKSGLGEIADGLPYIEGTAQADAWLAGFDEGRHIASREKGGQHA